MNVSLNELKVNHVISEINIIQILEQWTTKIWQEYMVVCGTAAEEVLWNTSFQSLPEQWCYGVLLLSSCGVRAAIVLGLGAAYVQTPSSRSWPAFPPSLSARLGQKRPRLAALWELTHTIQTDTVV